MPLLNYRTTISVDKTVAEIQALLVKHGARGIQLNYGDRGDVTSVVCALMTPAGLKGFRLPANVDGVWNALARERQKGVLRPQLVTKEHAARVAWRIVKDWIEAQVAVIDSGQITADQAFFAYMLTSTDETVYEALVARQFKMLPAVPNAD